jgi:hypothetical protein
MREGMDEEEAMRLAMKASQEQLLEPPPQTSMRHATTVMPPGLSEEETMRVAIEARLGQPPSLWDQWIVQAPAYHLPPLTV